MGLFWVDIEVGNQDGSRFETAHVMVDSGASYTSLPTSLLEGLGVERIDRMPFIHADGTRIDRDIGQTWVRIEGKSIITIVIFAEEDAPALLGAYTLEGVRMAPDPVNRRLVSVPGYLVSQWPAEGDNTNDHTE